MSRALPFVFVALAACSPKPDVAPPVPTPTAPVSAAPSVAATPAVAAPATATAPATAATATPAAPAHHGLRNYPPIALACSADADCGFAPTLRSDVPTSEGCCVVCDTYTAGTRAWADGAKALCSAAGPCNLPISCAEPPTPMVKATCHTGQCVLTKIPFPK